eukprot:4043943-Alexandrium_andersonii.AAC.1
MRETQEADCGFNTQHKGQDAERTPQGRQDARRSNGDEAHVPTIAQKSDYSQPGPAHHKAC